MEIPTVLDGSIGEKMTHKSPDNHVKNPGATYEQVEKALEWAGYEVERIEGGDWHHVDAEEYHTGIEVKDPATGKMLAEYGLGFRTDGSEDGEPELLGLISAGHKVCERAPYDRHHQNPNDLQYTHGVR